MPLALELSWHSHAQYGRYATELHHHEYQLSNHVRIGWQQGFVKDVGRLHYMIPVVRIGTIEQAGFTGTVRQYYNLSNYDQTQH